MGAVRGCGRGLLLIVALGAALALGACGAAATPTGGTARFSATTYAQQVPVAADPQGGLRWDKQEYTATAGAVTFVVRNESAHPHNFAIEGNGINVASPTFQGKTVQTYALPALAPGEYQIVCTLPGHREGGMVATLVVR